MTKAAKQKQSVRIGDTYADDKGNQWEVRSVNRSKDSALVVSVDLIRKLIVTQDELRSMKKVTK